MRSISTLAILLLGLAVIFWAPAAKAVFIIGALVGFAGRCCLAVLVFTFLATPSWATLIAFDLTFGTDGTGSFVYDDDDGGTNNGFTQFILDFSPVDTSFSNIQLTAAGLAIIGDGSVRTERTAIPADLFDILFDDPSHTGAFAVFRDLGGLTSPIFFAFTGMVANPAGTTVGSELCGAFVPGSGSYGFCTPTVSGFGQFSLNNTPVPEPGTLTLFATGLAGLGFVMRRRRSMQIKAVKRLPRADPVERG